MRRLDLTGEWTVRGESSKKMFKANLPGCIHADLLAVGDIPDPFVGRNLQESAWVAEEAWTYENSFSCDDFSGFSRVVLALEGVEGVATVTLNGVKLGKTDASLQRSEFDVKKQVKVGKNTLILAFEPAVKRAKGSVSPVTPSACMPTVGIAGDASILAFEGVRVTDVVIQQDFSTAPAFVGIDITVCTERFDPSRHMEVHVRICYKGNTLHEVRDILKKERQSLLLKLKNAQYWWPAGMGEQPLYEVVIDIYADRSCLEHHSKRIGIRDIHVQKGKDGQITVMANKQPVFVKGTRWMSPDLYPARLSRMEYARLVKATVVANMNLLRLHELSDFECNAFYDLCDEYGVMVWQDALDSDLTTHIRRVRHHASLAIWGCEDASVIKKLKAEDPGRAILPVELFLRKETLSVAAFPEQRIVQTYLTEEERNLSHPTSVYHAEEAAIPMMVSSFAKHFLFPSHFDSVLWLSQIQQGILLKREWEYVRCMLGDAKGFIHGRLNDFWPQCSTSTVDYEGRWKAAHYILRKAMMPLWTTGLFSSKTKQVELFAFNDLQKPFKGELVWRLVRTQGELVAEGSNAVALAPFTRDSVCELSLAKFLDNHGASDLFLWLELKDEKGIVSASNVVYFCEPREWSLPHPRMRADIRVWDDNSYAVTLTSPFTVMWVWLSLEGMDARFDDNYFCLEPGKPTRIRVTPARRIKPEQFNQLIRIGSLRDTWQEKRTLMQMVVPQKKVTDKK